METLFYSISLALFVLAILTFVLVIRETFPLLDSEDQTSRAGKNLRNGCCSLSEAVIAAFPGHGKRKKPKLQQAQRNVI